MAFVLLIFLLLLLSSSLFHFLLLIFPFLFISLLSILRILFSFPFLLLRFLLPLFLGKKNVQITNILKSSLFVHCIKSEVYMLRCKSQF